MAEHGRPEEEVVVDLEEPAPAEADVVDLPEGEGASDARGCRARRCCCRTGG